jgi:hypothetical protein
MFYVLPAAGALVKQGYSCPGCRPVEAAVAVCLLAKPLSVGCLSQHFHQSLAA